MSINEAGFKLIREFEGLRLKTYTDSGGVLSVGYGHTSAAGPPEVKRGMTITREEAERIFATDLLKFEAAVRTAITRPMNANQFAACISLAYNIGPTAFARSSVARRFNAGDTEGAAKALHLWIKDDGRVLPGLVRRRAAEARLFLTPVDAREPFPLPDAPSLPETAPRPFPAPWGAIAAVLAAAAALIWSWWEWIVSLFN